MAGPEYHAVAIANILNQDAMKPTPPALSFALLLLLALAAAAATRFSSTIAGAGWTGALFAG